MKLLFLFFVIGFSNFSYQLLTDADYLTAVERTYFQGVALLIVYCWDKWFWVNNND